MCHVFMLLYHVLRLLAVGSQLQLLLSHGQRRGGRRGYKRADQDRHQAGVSGCAHGGADGGADGGAPVNNKYILAITITNGLLCFVKYFNFRSVILFRANIIYLFK